MNQKQQFILASASPIRKQLLERAGLTIIVEAALIDEAEATKNFGAQGSDAAALAYALAQQKAQTISARFPQAIVLGADQVLRSEECWLGKPIDRVEARSQLRLLRGRAHELATAVCLVQDRKVLWHHIDHPRLTMRWLSDDLIDKYLETAGETVLGCVGAYQLEGIGAQLFSKVEGDYFSVLGLPLTPVLGALRRYGVGIL